MIEEVAAASKTTLTSYSPALGYTIEPLLNIFFTYVLPLMFLSKNLVQLLLLLLLLLLVRVFFIVGSIRACIEGSYSPALRAGQLGSCCGEQNYANFL